MEQRRKVQEEIQNLREKAEEFRSQAVELEYELASQSLVSITEPSHAQMSQIRALHEKAKEMNL